jgi:capsular polysaccharide biosynthesis protein
MDLLAMLDALRRHKLLVLLVLLGILGGDVYIAFGIPHQYESQAQYVLINPPDAPTESQIARDPALGRLNTDNPYLRLPGVVVVDVVAGRASSEVVRRELSARGADGDYQISGTNAIGAGLVIVIVGTGHTAPQARMTANVVAERMQSELHAMQKVNGADDRFLIRTVQVSPPTEPVRKVTGTVRSAIAVLAAGLVLLFALVSLAEAMSVQPKRPRPPKPSKPPKPPVHSGDATVPIRRPNSDHSLAMPLNHDQTGHHD